jgi:hypothetical protein
MNIVALITLGIFMRGTVPASNWIVYIAYTVVLLFIIKITKPINNKTLKKKYKKKYKKRYKKTSIAHNKDTFTNLPNKQKEIEIEKRKLNPTSNKTIDEETKKRKGDVGELKTEVTLQNIFENAHIYRNAYFSKIPVATPENPYPSNVDIGSNELDIVVVDKSGVYVIESKAWNCTSVKGDFADKTITPIYGNKAASSKPYNPIKQNEAHIKTLKTHLNIKNLPVKSVIVFSGEKKVNIELTGQSDSIVTNLKDLEKELTPYKNKTLISPEDFARISCIIKDRTEFSESYKQKHKEFASSF